MTVLWWVAESSVRLVLLAGFAAAALWALRVRSADVRLRVWTAVLLAAIVLPWLPDQWVLPLTSELAPLRAMPSMIADSLPLPALHAPTGGEPFVPIDLATVALAVYFAGVAMMLGLLGLGWASTRRLTSGAITVEARAFLESAEVHVPVTAGLLRPRIILPRAWREWPPETLEAVLAHEGAHAARRDGLWLCLALIHRAVLWINPVTWWLPRHMAALAERASDDAALTRGVPPTRYAEILLGFAAAVSTHHRRVAWILAMARPSGRDIERRLDRVLSWKGRAEMSRTRLAVLGLLLAAGSTAVYTATVSTLSSFPPDSPVLARFTPAVFVPEGAPWDRKHPIALTRVEPVYTAAGLRAGIQGTVELEVVIGALGEVTSARVIRSLDSTHGLDQAAIDAVKRWHFLPTTINGAPVASTAVVHLEFRTPRQASQKREPVVVAPVAIKQVDPRYTPEAMRAKIQGHVTLLLSIDEKGVVTKATIAESLDAEHGLDTNAIDAAMQWTFKPGTVDGAPKAFDVKVTMEFRIHEPEPSII